MPTGKRAIRVRWRGGAAEPRGRADLPEFVALRFLPKEVSGPLGYLSAAFVQGCNSGNGFKYGIDMEHLAQNHKVRYSSPAQAKDE